MMRSPDKPVFFDGTGRRWKRSKIVLALIFITLTATLVITVPKALSAVRLDPFETSYLGNRPDLITREDPAELASSLNARELPIFGNGPLLRVVRITHDWQSKAAVDPFTGNALSKISPADMKRIGNSDYAVERYGYTPEKTISITFDDGPDPVYTPKILDLLAREHIEATFFAVGDEIVKNQALAKRITAEGHILANHTFSHADLGKVNRFRGEQEINQTQRIIRAVTGHNPSYFRIPYGGNDNLSVHESLRAILEAQRLGYTVTSFQVDSNDWAFSKGEHAEYPDFSNKGSMVVLVHDGGGDRSQTLTYLENLIAMAKQHDYTFHDLDGAYQDRQQLDRPVKADLGDTSSFVLATMVYVWPKKLITGLFILSLGLLFYSLFINVLLAGLQIKKPPAKRRSPNFKPLVSVIVPAYNEEKVLEKCVRSILRSYYKHFEILIVNDGSTDKTEEIMKRLAKQNPRISALSQPNSGKGSAINHALAVARGEVIISIDADTVFPPRVIGKLIRHFRDPDVGAVAGSVKVGNIRNIVTRWQALEYIASINIERTAQSFMGAIMIAPGACSAWRKSAIVAANGYSEATLAEDCDLTLIMHKLGYKVVQDLEAESYTEAPDTLQGLAKQRFRWIFGNIQAFWKHRDMFFNLRYGWLGAFVLPRALLGQSIQFLFTPLLILVTLGNVLGGAYIIVLIYLGVSIFILFLAALIGIIYAKERYSFLLVTPFYRFGYGPIRTILLYASFLAALRGFQVSWNKLSRTGTVAVRERINS